MSVGPTQLLLILIIILVLFGAGKLPQVMKDLGKGVKSFKNGLKSEEENDSADQDKKKEDND